MRKILIATHGDMGKGMSHTLSFLTSLTSVNFIDAYTSDIAFESQIKQFFLEVKKDDCVIIFTDMQGGSVNQKFCEYRSENIHVICGVNLPIALIATLYPQDQEITKDVISEWISDARNEMIYMNQFVMNYDGDDE